MLAATALRGMDPASSQTRARKQIVQAVEDAHLDGSLARAGAGAGGGRRRLSLAAVRGLRPDELVVLALLKRLPRAARGDLAA